MLNSLNIAKAPEKTRVVVAMSGGVDSSVVAVLLKKQGYEVIGLTMQLYDIGATLAKKGACCAGQDINDARSVAEKHDIPHYVLDYENRFKDSVMDKFAESYLNGETPVPCIECNKTVKFHDMLKMARELEADCLATGHYVRSALQENGHHALFRPVDEARDQSYFLYGTTQDQLDFLRFPLGGLTKPQVRDLAIEYGLVVADKPDSQDICFVPDGDYAKIVKRLRPDAQMTGEIRHLDGRILGQHEGVMNYTIGQRKGLGVAVGEPLHVLRLDASKRTVLVGPKSALKTHEFSLKNINWLGDGLLTPQTVFVKVRSTRPPKEAHLHYVGEDVFVTMPQGEEGVARGQACVFYASQDIHARVLGGGTIKETDAPKVI